MKALNFSIDLGNAWTYGSGFPMLEFTPASPEFLAELALARAAQDELIRKNRDRDVIASLADWRESAGFDRKAPVYPEWWVF